MVSIIPKYKDESEKSAFFRMVKIETLNDLNVLIKELSEEELIYRGVHDSLYKVFSSYHQYLHREKGDRTNIPGERSIQDSTVLKKLLKETISTCEFQRTYMMIADSYASSNQGRYRIDTGFYRYLFYSLSKMQQYNENTFLVDFTYDIYVALLFSIYKYHGAQYISLLSFPIDKITYLNLNDTPEDIEAYSTRSLIKKHIKQAGLLEAKLYNVGEQLLIRPQVLLISGEEKYLRNKRQLKQQGCFLLYDPFDSGGIMDKGVESMISSGFYNINNKSGIQFNSFEISARLIPDIKKLLREKDYSPYKLGFNHCLWKTCW